MKKYLLLVFFLYIPLHIFITFIFFTNYSQNLKSYPKLFLNGDELPTISNDTSSDPKPNTVDTNIVLPNVKSITIFTDDIYKVFNNKLEHVETLTIEQGEQLVKDKQTDIVEIPSNPDRISNGKYTYKIQRTEGSQLWKTRDRTYFKIGEGKYIEVLKNEPLNVYRTLLAVLPNGDLIYEDDIYTDEIIKTLEEYMEYYGKGERRYYKREVGGRVIYLGAANLSGALIRHSGLYNNQFMIFEESLMSSYEGYLIIDILNNKIDYLNLSSKNDGRRQVYSKTEGKIIYAKIQAQKNFKDILKIYSYDIVTKKTFEIGNLVLEYLSPDHFSTSVVQPGDFTSSYVFLPSPDNTRIILQTYKTNFSDDGVYYSDLKSYLIDLNSKSPKLVNHENSVYCSLGYNDPFYNFLLNKTGKACLIELSDEFGLYSSGLYYIDQSDFLNPKMTKIFENSDLINMEEFGFINIE